MRGSLEDWDGRPADAPMWHAYRRHLGAEGKSPTTIWDYRDTLAKVSRSLPDGTDLWTMSRADVTGWLAAGAAGDPAAGTAPWARASLSTYSRRLRTFTVWACRAGYADTDPMSAVKPVREEVREIPLPDRADVARLAASVAKGRDFRSRRDWMIMCLLAEPGTPRASELAALPLDAPDLTHDCLGFTGKGGLFRVISLGAASCRAVTLYLRARAAHPQADLPVLLLGLRGPMTRHGIRQMLQDRCDAIGIGHIPPHHWRHLTADAAAGAGMTVPDMMKLFGWRTPLMASRYGAAAAGQRAVRHARELSIGDMILTGK